MSLDSKIESQQMDASETTSILEYLNSSKFSAVSYERDTYAEDIVIQKIIYYISLFKDNVR